MLVEVGDVGSVWRRGGGGGGGGSGYGWIKGLEERERIQIAGAEDYVLNIFFAVAVGERDGVVGAVEGRYLGKGEGQWL